MENLLDKLNKIQADYISHCKRTERRVISLICLYALGVSLIGSTKGDTNNNISDIKKHSLERNYDSVLTRFSIPNIELNDGTKYVVNYRR